MKFVTSYFYQIRFFTPNMIPLSTCCFDPKFFHQGKGKTFTFFDKNNVINGLRAEMFKPGKACEGLCGGREKCFQLNPAECKFLQTYYHQLSTEINLSDFLNRCEIVAQKVQQANHFKEEPIIAMMVWESYNNPCSERSVIQKFFKENSILCEEWERGV